MMDFVGKLWANPALQGASVVKKENQILGFIRENQAQLQAAFDLPAYFPGLGWDGSIRLLFSVLNERIVDSVEPLLDKILSNVLQTEVLKELEFQPNEFDHHRIKEFILKNLRNKATRDPYIAALETISFGLYERYIPKIMARHKVIHNELYRKDRMHSQPNVVCNFLQLASLFRPLFWHKFPSGSQELSMASFAKDPRGYEATVSKLQAVMVQEIGGVPERLLRAGTDSCLSAEVHSATGGSARLIAIMVSRAGEYDPARKQDRGAESPDKSWFHIHRKTAKYYGFDARYLDELYQIASEEGW